MNEPKGTAQPADAGQVDRPVGRPVPKRYEGGRIKGGCSLHDAEKPVGDDLIGGKWRWIG